MTKSKFNYTVGTVLIVVGIAVPSLTLIKLLRGEPPIDMHEQLILGAKIFKIGLIIFGVFFLERGRFSFFKLEKRSIESLPDSNRRLTIVILATILFTAFVLRLYGLNNGLWYDEIMTYVNYANTPFGEIITTFHSQNNHMLYSLPRIDMYYFSRNNYFTCLGTSNFFLYIKYRKCLRTLRSFI